MKSIGMVTTGNLYRIITDHLGSVRLVVDAQTGAVAQRMDYDEWGSVLEDTNPGFQPFGFAGGLYDPDTGLTRFGYRDYDPMIGRWLAKDPILFYAKQANLYAYCHGDPINFLDPYGLGDNPWWEDAWDWIDDHILTDAFTSWQQCGGGSSGMQLLVAPPPQSDNPWEDLQQNAQGQQAFVAGSMVVIGGVLTGVAGGLPAIGEYAAGYLVTGPADTPAGLVGVGLSQLIPLDSICPAD